MWCKPLPLPSTLASGSSSSDPCLSWAGRDSGWEFLPPCRDIDVPSATVDTVMLLVRRCSSADSRRARPSYSTGTSPAQRARHSSALFLVHIILATSSQWFTPYRAIACFKMLSSISDQQDDRWGPCVGPEEESLGVVADVSP
ncbi:hypothetical protein K445DRAFT_18889 [Daldinia sp. EC12]|nr:hypothetical protein F4774DRAFT_410228 [Daldinia eschscholtzii]OTB19281.1 hypothetical protein K445DRAFT_18889 [Daldinia sp. EC12]